MRAGLATRSLICSFNDGVIAIRDGELRQSDSLKIHPVDTVGAGDTLCGYLASGVDQGMAFEVALARAATAASLTCLLKGAQAAIPRSEDVLQAAQFSTGDG